MQISEKTISCELAVIGGGIAGICTAAAAAKNGVDVVLVQDRPMLGGNASSEIRMWVCGAHGTDAKEGGLLEELLLMNRHENPQALFPLWDDVMYSFVKKYGVRVLFNTSIHSVETENHRITSVTGWNLTEYAEYRISARYFADCSGDSILRLSGADYTSGRESSFQYGESHAPEKADAKTMGNSILIQLRKVNKHRPFIAPKWAYHYTDDTVPRKEYTKQRELKNENFWWIEYGGVRDTVGDADAIREELLKIVYGIWEYIKNHPDRRAAEWELDWIGKLPGKRESARYLGDHVMIQPEVEAGGKYPDTVAYGGWTMDDHNPEAIYTNKPATIFHPAPSPFGIPYRSLYSRNVENLWFAGRNISVSHMALSSVRVMATAGLMGQSVGTAVSLAKKYELSARSVGERHLAELQQTLQEQDQYLPGIPHRYSERTGRAKYSHEILRNGVERSLGGTDNGVWLSPGESTLCEWDSPEEHAACRIVFDSDFKDLKRMRNLVDPEREEVMPPMLAKTFSLECRLNGVWRTVFTETENLERLRLIPLDGLEADAVRLNIGESWNGGQTHLFALEVK